MSFNQYLNGAYLYREVKTGIPQYVEKVFPLYEINTESNSWAVVYVPKKNDAPKEQNQKEIVEKLVKS